MVVAHRMVIMEIFS